MKIRLFVSGNLIKSGRNLKKNKEKIQISVVKAEKLGKIAKNWKKRECILTKINENKVVCTWKFKKKWSKL